MRKIAEVITSIGAGLVLMAWGIPDDASAQYLFIDTNGDAVATGADHLLKSGDTRLDFWIQTDRSRDGLDSSPDIGTVPASICSYAISLRASGGSVEWGRYSNAQPSMVHSFGEASSSEEFFTGFGGTEYLKPGKYRLGSVQVRVLSGDPSIEFIPKSGIQNAGYTAFGSVNRGRESDHTLKLSIGSGDCAGVRLSENRGDWSDADGAASPSGRGGIQATEGAMAEPQVFGVKVAHVNSARVIRFGVTTTRDGAVRVRLFDVSGRLIRSVESSHPAAGKHDFEIPTRTSNGSRMGNGIYFYRVEAVEGIRTGKVAIVQ